MQDIYVRRAKPADREQMLAISAQIWEGNDYLPQVLDQWMADANGELSVALLDEKIVGFSKITELVPGHGWLQGARVDPAIQGKGIGRALTKYHIELAEKSGMSHLRMVTDDDNTAARRLAEQLGFRLIGQYYRLRAKPLAAKEAESVPIPPLFQGTPPAPANGQISLGWTFYPWQEEIIEKLRREAKLYGNSQAGMAMPESHRRERALISYLWGEPGELREMLQFARRQPAHVERINCVVTGDSYRQVLHEAGYENVDERHLVLYEYQLE